MDAKHILARNLNLLMERHKLTNEGLAAAIGASNSTISRIRRGTNAAQISTLDQIGKHFGVSAWQLLLPDFDPTDQVEMDARDQRLLEKLAALVAAKK